MDARDIIIQIPLSLGFSHTHLSGTGVGDYGDIRFMPCTGEIKINPGDHADAQVRILVHVFSHKHEKASPGYYQVFLDDYRYHCRIDR